MVAVHIGEIAKPRKNKAAMTPVIPKIISWRSIAGTNAATASPPLTAISSERVICRLWVRRSR